MINIEFEINGRKSGAKSFSDGIVNTATKSMSDKIKRKIKKLVV